MPTRLATVVHRSAEWILHGHRHHDDPWTAITVTATVTGPDGERQVPAFWAGGDAWRIRITAATPGEYRLWTTSSDAADAGLHGHEAVLSVAPVDANDHSPLFRHGPVRVAGSGFAHADGTPFSWLGDTWWMLLSDRVRWPDGFQDLADHRAAQGFTVAQVVAGFPGDITPFDGRDGNEGGTPWESAYRRINPRYFDGVDARLNHLIRRGIVPCILGSWGYHLLFMGQERMAEHWRYLVARYAAWPVIWCLAGEGGMHFYLSKQGAEDTERQKLGWAAIARQVRQWDPWRRPLTIHPRSASWDDIAEPELLDFHMLQPGHLPGALGWGVELIDRARTRYPTLPVVNAEPPYEGHGGTNGPDIQRYSFWSSLLSGAAGYTYGAAGIFQANDRDRPTGDRPDGGAFDRVTWDEAVNFPGAAQVAAGMGLLRSLPWSGFATHPEWVTTPLRWGAEQYRPALRGYAAGIPGECRVVYVPLRWYHWECPIIHQLEPGMRYRAAYIDPVTFCRFDQGIISGGADGTWQGGVTPYLHDWLLVLERERVG